MPRDRGATGAGEVVAVLGGRVVDDAELRHIATDTGEYNSAAIGESTNVFLENDELLARGNHSCDPNLWMRDAFTLEARRDIVVDEELTSDYAMLTAVDWEMACHCGSSLCRHVIRGTDWRTPVLQQRYAGHLLTVLECTNRHARNIIGVGWPATRSVVTKLRGVSAYDLTVAGLDHWRQETRVRDEHIFARHVPQPPSCPVTTPGVSTGRSGSPGSRACGRQWPRSPGAKPFNRTLNALRARTKERIRYGLFRSLDRGRERDADAPRVDVKVKVRDFLICA